ncbi:iron-containing redox enzyme family protein [Pyxidicoccus xibeiensis]|uniref:iron-containing redox enzyme family protein n=1 Tax=Pyxidicoccus xibeiensis TaxID=2906759 RepID=UPI0020A81221|nr:iron-containing redox enzyme family protein [Pyxidicoccus xibeiensis]MCP3139291.1 iron-containing redox enzyme family protein [Pyxidicoccus xibeiensis]
MTTELIRNLEQEAKSLVTALDVHPEARRLFEGTADAEQYAGYLVQTYHYVRWTAPLLGLAGRRMLRLGRHPMLAELLVQKSREESGHERWLLADLRALGWSQERVEATPACAAVRAYVNWNRFTAEAGMPTAFLGTAYMLEHLSVERAGLAAERLVARGAIPNVRRAVTFLRGHAGADGDHVAELASVLSRLEDPAEQEALLLSARTTRALYPALFTPAEESGAVHTG